jgi:selenocysteine lyase/cysteine desulfurase
MDKYIYIDKTDIIIEPPIMKNKIKMLMADATATGLPSPFVEKYIMSEILPYYSNTHSNAYCSNYMNTLMNDTRKYIKKLYKLDENKIILFSGNGATGAINHLVNLIDYNKYKRVNIIISVYEHYSNYLPWMKIRKENKNVVVWFLPLNSDGQINLNLLEIFFKNHLEFDCLNIVSITACSNVTGIKTDLDKVKLIISNNNPYNNIKLFVDMACLAPYDGINGNMFDCFFFSGHKFIGGNGTPGVLIVDKKIIQKKEPFFVGGGTVDIATNKIINYKENIEERESAGTPNIIGIIKLKKVLELNEKYIDIIKNNEKIITKYIHQKLMVLHNRYRNLNVIFLNETVNNRLPIICINIDNLHYNEIVRILSDNFGIQTRGGNSCAGLFGTYIKTIGWCRITFSWYMSFEEINYILNAIQSILIHLEKK